jgi:hypothetical protein
MIARACFSLTSLRKSPSLVSLYKNPSRNLRPYTHFRILSCSRTIAVFSAVEYRGLGGTSVAAGNIDSSPWSRVGIVSHTGIAWYVAYCVRFLLSTLICLFLFSFQTLPLLRSHLLFWDDAAIVVPCFIHHKIGIFFSSSVSVPRYALPLNGPMPHLPPSSSATSISSAAGPLVVASHLLLQRCGF